MSGSRNGKGRARADTEPEGYYKGEPSKLQVAMVEAELAQGKPDYWFWLQCERRAPVSSLKAAFRHYTKRVHTDHNRHECAQLVTKVLLAAKESILSSRRAKTEYARELVERQRDQEPEEKQRLLCASECVRGAVLKWYEQDAADKQVTRRVKAMMAEAEVRRNERLSKAKFAADAASTAAVAAARAAQAAWDAARLHAVQEQQAEGVSSDDEEGPVAARLRPRRGRRTTSSRVAGHSRLDQATAVPGLRQLVLELESVNVVGEVHSGGFTAGDCLFDSVANALMHSYPQLSGWEPGELAFELRAATVVCWMRHAFSSARAIV